MEIYDLKPNYNYILMEGAIKCQATGGSIPKVTGNRHYREYLAWLEEGNTPIPIQPSPYHELIDNEWVEDTELKEKTETEAAQEVLIEDKTREIAIEELKTEGKLPPGYTDSKKG